MPLRHESPLAERWEIAAPLVKTMRLWSVFVEEGIFNFSLLGMYQLDVDTEEFVRVYTELVKSGAGSRDDEGTLFVVTQEMLKALLFSGECTARGLFHEETQTVKAEDRRVQARFIRSASLDMAQCIHDVQSRRTRRWKNGRQGRHDDQPDRAAEHHAVLAGQAHR